MSDRELGMESETAMSTRIHSKNAVSATALLFITDEPIYISDWLLLA